MDTKHQSKFLFIIFLLSVSLSSYNCNRGTGCPAEDAHVKVDKRGKPKKKAESGLFDKKTMKKMGK